MGQVVSIASARSTSESRTSRELRRLLADAHHRMDDDVARFGTQRDLDRSGLLTFEQFQRAPLRTSIYGYEL